MSSGWSLCYLLLLLGGNLAVIVKIHQESIDGTVGQSVLLPVSYRFSAASRFPVSVIWRFANSQDPFIACALQNCSLGAGGEPSNCSTTCFTHAAYRGRTELFLENGSLLLRDLQLNDSGVYRVGFRHLQQTWPVTLTVHEQRSSTEHPGGAGTEKQGHIHYYVTGICSSVFLLLLFLLFCYIRRRGAAQQQKRRIIKQQVSSVEESHMESAAVRDTATIYARIGDNFEQPQLRTTPEVVYTSITSSPDPPGLEAGPYHLLI
ncbi:uncharacterized protein LJ206_015267 isoform 2-T2 [Theristicus caerulescens]